MSREVTELREEVVRLKNSKLELIRSTSTEIERLRTIIRGLTGHEDSFDKLNNFTSAPTISVTPAPVQNGQYTPSHPVEPEKSTSVISTLSDAEDEERKKNQVHSSTPNKTLGDIQEDKETVDSSNPNYSGLREREKAKIQAPSSSSSSSNSKQQQQQQTETPTETNNGHEEKNKNDNTNANANANASTQTQTQTQTSTQNKGNHRRETSRFAGEELFSLDKKRYSPWEMSAMGFEFKDTGFMTTDFDQLRGHNLWINQVIHHPIQNGICVSCGDDWCVMFWRFRRVSGKEQLEQEKFDKIVSRLGETSRERKVIEQRVHETHPSIKTTHQTGEITLNAVFKINTGTGVKAIQLSPNGELLACACFDDEESEGIPELQLYRDQKRFTFQSDELEIGYGKETKRVITRKIIRLDFEPVVRGLAFTRDSSKVFVAMIGTKKKLEEESERDSDEDEDIPPDEKMTKPEKPCSLAVIDAITKKVTPCDRVNAMMGEKEHVNALAVSPDGLRLAVGTNYGRLIVCHVQMLTDPKFDSDQIEVDSNRFWIAKEDENNPALQEFLNVGDDRNIYEGSITSIAWSPDGEWLTTGYGNGIIKLWKKTKDRRMTVNLNRIIGQWMKRAHVQRKTYDLFTCRWELDGQHGEAVNGICISNSMMASASDDGSIVLHDLYQTFADQTKFTKHGLTESSSDIEEAQETNDNNNPNNKEKAKGQTIRYYSNKKKNPESSQYSQDQHPESEEDMPDNSPIRLARIDQSHKRRMVTSIALTNNYQDELMMVPTAGLYLVSSGADHRVICKAVTDVIREALREKNHKRKPSKKLV